jgi:hypothetical protein
LSNPRTLADQDAGFIQLPEDGTGKQVAHVLIDETQSDGSEETLYLPRMVITGADGEIAEVRNGALRLDVRDLEEAVERLTATVESLKTALLLIHT